MLSFLLVLLKDVFASGAALRDHVLSRGLLVAINGRPTSIITTCRVLISSDVAVLTPVEARKHSIIVSAYFPLYNSDLNGSFVHHRSLIIHNRSFTS